MKMFGGDQVRSSICILVSATIQFDEFA